MSMPMDEFLAPRIPPEPTRIREVADDPGRARVDRERDQRARLAQFFSVLLTMIGVGGVLTAIVVLAGWPWALLAGSAAMLYAAYVIATHH